MLCVNLSREFILKSPQEQRQTAQNIRISYDLVGFIPVKELLKQETA